MSADTPTSYTIRVADHLDDHWASWLGNWDLQRDPDGTTTLTGNPEDQAQLHGLLAALRDIGATLVSVTACLPPGRMPAIKEISHGATGQRAFRWANRPVDPGPPS